MLLYHWNCLDVMKGMEDNSVDSIVTDPPYGLSFMGKKRDYDVPSKEIREEALRVLKPGGHLLAFAWTRTQHRMAVNIEDAGFEIRDMIAWVYGSGFPKSLNIGKAVDKIQGNERENLGSYQDNFKHDNGVRTKDTTASQRPFQWNNTKWGKNPYLLEVTKWNSPREWRWSALKPALEPITFARKPLGEKTIAANVLKYGTWGINIDGCRIPWIDKANAKRLGKDYTTNDTIFSDAVWQVNKAIVWWSLKWRFPANFIHDWSDEVVELFPITNRKDKRTSCKSSTWMFFKDSKELNRPQDNWWSAARFFYCAKASKKDREWSKHPTMKPTKLMQYLVRLVTPPGWIVLDPFMWSWSTGKACMLEWFNFIGIDMEKEYVDIARARIENARDQRGFFEYQKLSQNTNTVL